MRLNTIMAAVLLFGTQFTGSASPSFGATKGGHPITDPMFGVVFDPRKVKYEPMPMVLRHLCRGYERGTYWTFAHLRKDDAEYFVVLGTHPGQDGDELGVAINISGSKCQQYDSSTMLSGFVPSGGYREASKAVQLPGLDAPEVCDQGDCHYLLRSAAEEDILRGLVRDALLRGTRAWGDARFKKAVCSPRMKEANSSMPIVQQEVSKFCKQS